MSSFGEIIKSSRLQMGLTLREVSKIININPGSIHKYENNTQIPSSKSLRILCDFYNLDFTEINKYLNVELYDFGTKLKRIRLKHNMSQNDLAKIIGVHKGMISSYETGEYKPRRKILDKICELYGNEFLYNEEILTEESTNTTLQFGDIIRNKRIEKCYSKSQIQKILNININTLSRYENNITIPSLYTIKKYAIFIN